MMISLGRAAESLRGQLYILGVPSLPGKVLEIFCFEFCSLKICIWCVVSRNCTSISRKPMASETVTHKWRSLKA